MLIGPVELSSEAILLRPYRLEDAVTVFVASTESVDTVGRWMPWCHAGYTQAESIAWIERCQAMWQNGEAYEFAAFDAESRYVGGAGINQFNRLHNFANVGYWIRQSRQRHGLAAEAVRLIAQFGFKALGLTRLEIVIASANTPSRRVAEKAGAQREGLARNRIILKGAPLDAAMYSLVPPDSPSVAV